MMGDAAAILDLLRATGRTLAVAESLTGGELCSAFVAVPGASDVLRGGVVVYQTPTKAAVLGVDAVLLGEVGPVDAEVARQMADGVRERLGLDGSPADVGVATTGVAGPGAQDGVASGTVWVGVAIGGRRSAHLLRLEGGRAAVRAGAVAGALTVLRNALEAADEQEYAPGAQGSVV